MLLPETISNFIAKLMFRNGREALNVGLRK
jgi:hypothetical protein